MLKLTKAKQVLACSLFVACTAQAANDHLDSIKINSTITLDGSAEVTWDKAIALTVTLDKFSYNPSNY